ncbi:hypothetical protein [Frankia sp. Cas3]|uniref:hypothetical protein n=1 Tax=Frankia sp. Cas3 TaxID=3073926 RepID=UPI002AD29021|nr:hypothetical protein [Frankia sp. Cas3]
MVQALLCGLWAEGIDGEIFNVGDDAPITACEILRLNNIAPDPDAAQRVLDDPWKDIIDSSKIRRVLGFRLIYPNVYAAAPAPVRAEPAAVRTDSRRWPSAAREPAARRATP